MGQKQRSSKVKKKRLNVMIRIKQHKNAQLWHVTNEDAKEHNPNWSEILDHLCRILVAGGSRSGKTNALLNLINHEPDTDKIYSYVKDPYETKYHFN